MVLLTGAWVLVGVIQGCGKATPDPVAPTDPSASEATPDDRLFEDCFERHRVELILGEVAVNTLEAYGSLDPEFFSPPRAGTVELRAGERRPRNDGKVGDLQGALRRLNADESALAAFQKGRESAIEACKRVGCSKQQFTFEVKKENLPDEGDIIYHLTVKDEIAPTESDWKEGFLPQYSVPASAKCQALLPVLRVPDPQGPEASAQRGPGSEKGLASGGRISTIAAYVSGPCVGGNVNNCSQTSCQRNADTVSKWHNYGSSKCCVGC